MAQNPKNPSGKMPPGQLSQVFVRARAHLAKQDDAERDYFVNIADINCMFEHEGNTVLWRSSVASASVSAYTIPGMGIGQVAEALATRGVELVDLKQVHDGLAAKKVKNIYKPVKM
jgi:hypothetical protein